MPEQRRIPQPRSGEPERNKKPVRRGGCFSAIIYFLFVIGASALFAGLGWLCADDVLALTKEDITASVEIDEDDNISEIADKLNEAGIVRYPFLFRLYAKFSNAEEKIHPGSYEVKGTMDYRALVSAMRSTSTYRSIVNVTIPEGFTVEQILLRLSDYGVNTYENLLDVCENYDFEYSFLEGLPEGKYRLEGFLFPDTYSFYVNENPVSAINKLLSNYNRKMTQSLREKIDQSGYTMREILTIASLIEKEAANNDERGKISSVIYNRLNSKNLRLLQIDATIQYVLPERKGLLSREDTLIDNPYNTYKYEGLPPGPICNPGIASIKAALNPENTKYYFYALTKEGVHEFSRTSEEHQRVIDENPEVYGR
ncbi:MAG: endolytic transglycosylase MltG [Eubacteriales bacterium]|jgi:UPF0755 protein